MEARTLQAKAQAELFKRKAQKELSFRQNLKASQENAQQMKKQADYASSKTGMAWNALKSAPRATADVLFGTAPKFIASAVEAPEIALKGKYTNRTYKIPGLSPFKSYQSDFGDVEKDVIEGRKGLGSAAWSLAQAPLAGVEMLGIGNGLQKTAQAGKLFAKSPSFKGAKNVGLDFADTFLPTTRGVGKTEQKLKTELADLQMQRVRAALAEMEKRKLPQPYRSGVKLEISYKEPPKNQLVQKIKELENLERQKKKAVDIENLSNFHKAKMEYGALKEAEEFSGRFFDDELDSQYQNFKNLLRRFNKGKAKDEILGGDYRSISRVLSEKGVKEGDIARMLYSTEKSEDEVLDSFRSMLSSEMDRVKFARPMKTPYPEESSELSNLKRIYNEKIEAINRGELPDAPKKEIATIGKITTNPVDYKKFIEELLNIKERKSPRNIKRISELEKELKNPALFVQDLPKSKGEVLSQPRKLITSGGRMLRESGEGGKTLDDLIRRQQLGADLRIGGFNKKISEILQGLSKEERVNVTDVLEGKAKPIGGEASNAAQKMRKFYDDIAKEAERRQFNVRTPEGEVPFKARENYAPRIYNWDEMTKANRREEMLQHLVDSGQARNKAEAGKLFDDFISTNAQRRAGNLENARLLDLPGYEKDAEKAARIYAERVGRRFSEAEAFGKKDEVAAALIDKIANEGGDYQEAQRVFDYLFQGLPKNKVVDAVTKFNLATKLDLGAITNVTQSVNTATKAGIRNTAKALLKGFTKEGKDIAEMANVYDDMVILQETGISMGRIVRTVMKPFQAVERFNRRTAALAGKFRAEELAKILSKNPEDKLAIRQLSSLGLDPKRLFTGKLTGKDILTAANKMSELTQFKPNVLNVPTAWRSPIGRLLMQFKSFSYMQTRFMVDEIAKELKNGNPAPLLRFLTMSPIVSYLAYKTRNLVAGRDEYEDKRNLDVRKFDKYFGAGKSFITEPITQGDFLADTYTNPYATPLKKVTRTAGSFLGPGIGEIGNTMVSLEDMANKAEKNRLWYENHPEAQSDPWLMLKRQAVGSIPFVGELAKNTAFGFEDTAAEKARAMAKEGLKAGDMGKVREAMTLDPYLNSKRVIENIKKEIQEERMSPGEKELYERIKEESRKKNAKPFFVE